MRNKLTFLVIFTTFCLLSLQSFSQKAFEGIITYQVSITGEGAEGMQAFMPTEFKYFLKNRSVKLVMSGGFSSMLGEYIIDGDKGISYLIKPEEKTYSILNEDSQSKSVSNSEFMNETVTIAGYECKKYESVTTDANGEKTTSYVWSTDKITIKPPKNKVLDSNVQLLFGSIEKGFPLKVVTSNLGFVLTLTASSVENKKLSKKEFQVPKGFTLTAVE